MARFHYQCPACRSLLQSGREVAGRKVRCTKCETVFVAAIPDRRSSRALTVLAVLLASAMCVAGIALAAIALTKQEPPSQPPNPVALGPVENEHADKPESGTQPDNLPVRTSVARFVEATQGGDPEENIPAAPPPRKQQPLPDPKLPTVRPIDPPPDKQAPRPTPKAPDPKTEGPAKQAQTPATVDDERTEPKDLPKNGEAAQPESPATGNRSRDLYAKVDAYALAAPPEAEASLFKLAKYLHAGTKTEHERARAVYRWVTDRISYDVQALLSGHNPDPGPEATFQRKMGVCAGYSSLFVDLCQRCGLAADFIGGYSKDSASHTPTYVSKPEHAWSSVRLDGKWFLVDATWGAGTVHDRQFHKQFSDFYFATPPEQLIFTHLPENARWQLKKPTITLDEFNRRPTIGATLFEMGISAESIERVIAGASYQGIVRSFALPGEAKATGAFPVERNLRGGTQYQFEFKSNDFVSFAFIQDHRFTYFKRDNGTFRGSIRPHSGQLMVGAKLRGDQRGYAVLLEYTVE